MPNPNGIPVHVGVNCQGISYDSATGQWTVPSNAPQWTVPATTPVSSGNNLITWTLQGTNVQSGFQLVFDPSAGIAFESGWPGSTPALQGDGTYQATDDFTPGPNTYDYPYGITVVLQSTNDNSISHSFSLDPDVQNEGANPVISYARTAAAV
jgi:hypothetical protein